MTLYSAILPEIPTIPGPTKDRLLMVRLQEAVSFGGRVETEINTLREGHQAFVLRLRTVQGHPVVAIGYKGDVRLVPWEKVIQSRPHPDMEFDEGPVVYPDGWEEPALGSPWQKVAQFAYRGDCALRETEAEALKAAHDGALPEQMPGADPHASKPAKRRGRPPKVPQQ